MRLIIEGLIVHVIFLLSIFDIYFKSPIISGIQPEDNGIDPPAKRLILIVADGLRADSFLSLENGSHSYSPYLRNIIENKGAWGVCHARVPTESRPGHVALIAGFYEDPSAVFKGWKENPVEFDSLFNQSSITYSWGSPDILPIFGKGHSEKINMFMYSSEFEDFSGKNESASKLSEWVFDQFESFFENAKTNSSLIESFNKNGVVFFLHLLGTDVAGHVNKPHSREYKENIECIDRGVEKVEKIVREFYKDDNKTVFVFTSDHGMTDWGSHGDGSVSETETPVIIWGAGVSGPKQVKTSDVFSLENWGLGHLLRRDMQQADLVPLMSVLIGIPIPVHSLGTLPLSYLDVANKTSAEALYLNFRQLYSQFKRHREIIEKDSISWLYKPFARLGIEEELDVDKTISELITIGSYGEAISMLKLLISLVLSGLKYYQNYYQKLLLFAISCSYIGWIAWLCIQILPQTKICNKKVRKHKTTDHLVINLIFFCCLLTTVVLIYAQALPFQYYIYCCLPIVLWWAVFRKHLIFLSLLTYVRENLWETFITVSIYGVGIELLVLTFFYRWVLCIVLCGLGIWPLLEKNVKHKNYSCLFLWFLTCFGLAIFPALPIVGSSPNTKLVIFAGWLWLIVGVVLIVNQVMLFKNKEDCLVLVFQLSIFPLTIWIVSSTADSYDLKLGLPTLNRVLSWILLIVCPFIPLIGSVKIMPRLGAVSLSLAVPFLLLSIGHEAFFSLILTLNLFTWISVEKDVSSVKSWSHEIRRTQAVLTRTDFRRSFFFIVYIILSFFGTGNIASINSFDPVWVRCFLTTFAPFTMTVLILVKILIPFLLVSCSFRALNIITKAWTNHLFVMMLIHCDFMGLHFLYAVTNEGSWLQIGTSISHYVIIQTMIIFIVTLYIIANVYMQSSFFCKLPSESKFLPGKSLESRAVHVNNKEYQNTWYVFDKRHVE